MEQTRGVEMGDEVQVDLPTTSHVQSEQVGPRSVSPVTRPSLWSATARFRSISGDRPKYERDSLRTRSQEGRPGSRKNRRWNNSLELIHSLHRLAATHGGDDEEVVDNIKPESRPSAFYRLLELEGAEGALEAWTSAESSRKRPSSRPRRSRTEGTASAAREAEHAVRHAFHDTLKYIHGNSATQKLLAELEVGAARAFAKTGECVIDNWQLNWDGDAWKLDTVSGEPPAKEMEVFGLSAIQRKVVHQFARVLGLTSESRDLEQLHGPSREGDGKTLALRLPYKHCGRETWTAPFSVTNTLVLA